MNAVDLVIVGFALVLAVWGYHQGLIVGGLSLAGFIGGALLGSRVAPLVLAQGAHSPYAPLGALIGALLIGGLLALFGETVGWRLRSRVGAGKLDGLGGAILLAAVGLLIAWIAGAAALQTPVLKQQRRDVQRSAILSFLDDTLPPTGPVLNALKRFDPVPRINGPSPKVGPPPPGIVNAAGVRNAQGSVVRVVGTACGLNVEGSGWVAEGGLIVTNAHVVAGQDDTQIQVGGTAAGVSAQAVAFDPKNDLAILRSPAGDGLTPLQLDLDPKPGTPAAILGYPENGPFDAEPGRVGQTSEVISQDAYGRGPVTREMTALRGNVREGNSGGPMVDASGRVVTLIFASADRPGTGSGYGVPTEIVARALGGADPSRTVSTGPCVS